MDHISVHAWDNEKLTALVEKNADMIRTAVMADSIDCTAADASDYQKEWDINGESLKLSVKKL